MTTETYHAFDPLAVGGANSLIVHGDGKRAAITVEQGGNRASWVVDPNDVEAVCAALRKAVGA
jgi:hypothetical protein